MRQKEVSSERLPGDSQPQVAMRLMGSLGVKLVFAIFLGRCCMINHLVLKKNFIIQSHFTTTSIKLSGILTRAAINLNRLRPYLSRSQ